MTPAKKGNPVEERAIQDHIEAMVAAWNRHDVKAMSLLHAEDADMINPFGDAAKSRSEIEALYGKEHGGPLKDSRLSLKSEGVRFLSPDIAVSDNSFEVSGARDPSGNTRNMHGHLTLVLKKHDGAWQVEVSRPVIPAARP